MYCLQLLIFNNQVVQSLYGPQCLKPLPSGSSQKELASPWSTVTVEWSYFRRMLSASVQSSELFLAVPFLFFCIRKGGRRETIRLFFFSFMSSYLRIWEISLIYQELNTVSFFPLLWSRLHVLSHWRRTFVGVQTAGCLLTNCPLEHPSFLQYQILSTEECYWALEAFLCSRDEADQNFEVQHQDDISEVLSTFTKARVRTRCVVEFGRFLLSLISIQLETNCRGVTVNCKPGGM